MAKRKKDNGRAIWLTLLGFIGLGALVTVLARNNDIILFNPKGLIATEQRELLVLSTLIMLGFAFGVLFFLYFFAWKYRETNQKAKYDPDAGRSKLLGLSAWVLPSIIFVILASIMIPATFRLEPQDRIETGQEPLKIQVVALRWKWLFIYPEQDIATVNYVQIPVNTPVEFQLTADETPMSSFWIPHLGGQLYAMTEHVNRLNLMADSIGDYEGSAAEINGPGFAGMRFNTRVSEHYDFEKWVDGIKTTQNPLDMQEYEELLKPSKNSPVAYYSKRDSNLYATILSKYAGSHGGSHGEHGEQQEVEIEHYEGH